jgi:hypothetical protein
MESKTERNFEESKLFGLMEEKVYQELTYFDSQLEHDDAEIDSLRRISSVNVLEAIKDFMSHEHDADHLISINSVEAQIRNIQNNKLVNFHAMTSIGMLFQKSKILKNYVVYLESNHDVVYENDVGYSEYDAQYRLITPNNKILIESEQYHQWQV